MYGPLRGQHVIDSKQEAVLSKYSIAFVWYPIDHLENTWSHRFDGWLYDHYFKNGEQARLRNLLSLDLIPNYYP